MDIYVSTYRKYNEGNLKGEWIDPSEYESKADFLAACGDVHADEQSPELMFQDYKGIPGSFIRESWVSDVLWDYIEALGDNDEDAMEAYVEWLGTWDLEDFQDKYQGEYGGWDDFATRMVEDLGYLDEIPQYLRCYFDYEAFGRDLRLKGDYYSDGTYFFRND